MPRDSITRRNAAWFRAALFCLALACLAGCASGPQATQDLEAIVHDREASDARRVAAIGQWCEQADAGAVDASYVYGRLHDLLWTGRVSEPIQVAAMDWLIARDADAFWVVADRRMNSLAMWRSVRVVCARAVADQREDFVLTAIRHWSRPSSTLSDEARPEARAVRVLVPHQSVHATLLEVVQGRRADARAAHQMAAWAVFCRLEPERCAGVARELHGGTQIAQALRASSRLLADVPREREALLWMVALYDPTPGSVWSRASASASRLDTSQRAGLALRHLPLLARGEAGLGWPPRRALVQSLGQRFANTPVTPHNKPLNLTDSLPSMERSPPRKLRTRIERRARLELSGVDWLYL